mmetsp:Transcript_27101/g.76264  ORF Transcript_27101/g.76264 Transcript_27101/m.76264 type:complete len:847 (+) Transcript_27101:469-3009(+)|eukprot:CAMPEP_0119548848 /NCGR_PEP_ID=MMETSP1352-20130426/2681_1 /TAXON_ID=265584 /ORGANISM="Stauroneis constricta, Strain CCMP1120" /LENGTH=846 /DNA_ID=CAMNT_0007594241 /DNA_START=475 /DNA_END=3015 /DNA_ORIENTATION=-
MAPTGQQQSTKGTGIATSVPSPNQQPVCTHDRRAGFDNGAAACARRDGSNSNSANEISGSNGAGARHRAAPGRANHAPHPTNDTAGVAGAAKSDVTFTPIESSHAHVQAHSRLHSQPPQADAVPTSGKQYVHELRINDVLMGRGTGSNDHEGNITFRKLVCETNDEYQTSRVRGDKTRISRKVIAMIHAKKGRFLRRLQPDEVNEVLRQGAAISSSEPASSNDPFLKQYVYEVVTDDSLLVQKTKQAFRHLIRHGSLSHLHNQNQERGRNRSNPHAPTRAQIHMLGMHGIHGMSGVQGMQQHLQANQQLYHQHNHFLQSLGKVSAVQSRATATAFNSPSHGTQRNGPPAYPASLFQASTAAPTPNVGRPGLQNVSGNFTTNPYANLVATLPGFASASAQSPTAKHAAAPVVQPASTPARAPPSTTAPLSSGLSTTKAATTLPASPKPQNANANMQAQLTLIASLLNSVAAATKTTAAVTPAPLAGATTAQSNQQTDSVQRQLQQSLALLGLSSLLRASSTASPQQQQQASVSRQVQPCLPQRGQPSQQLIPDLPKPQQDVIAHNNQYEAIANLINQVLQKPTAAQSLPPTLTTGANRQAGGSNTAAAGNAHASTVTRTNPASISPTPIPAPQQQQQQPMQNGKLETLIMASLLSKITNPDGSNGKITASYHASANSDVPHFSPTNANTNSNNTKLNKNNGTASNSFMIQEMTRLVQQHPVVETIHKSALASAATLPKPAATADSAIRAAIPIPNAEQASNNNSKCNLPPAASPPIPRTITTSIPPRSNSNTSNFTMTTNGSNVSENYSDPSSLSSSRSSSAASATPNLDLLKELLETKDMLPHFGR